jgi:hypothetical protein
MAKANQSYDLEDLIAMVLVAALIGLNAVIWGASPPVMCKS